MRRTITGIDLSIVKGFQDLSAPTKDALAASAVLYTLADRETLYYQGDSAEAFYFVLEGGVRLVEHMIESSPVNLKIYGPGDVFGLLAISGSFPHPSEVTAIGPTHIGAINGRDAREIMQQHPDFALAVVDMLVAHIHHAHSRLGQMMAERAERRLARALLTYADKFGRANEKGQILIDAPLTQTDIAQFTGVSAETVNRMLKQFEQRGILAGRTPLCICDRDALAQLSGGDGFYGAAMR